MHDRYVVFLNHFIYGHKRRNTVILGEDEKDKPKLSHNIYSDEEMMLQQSVAFRLSFQALRRSFQKFKRHFENQKIKKKKK